MQPVTKRRKQESSHLENEPEQNVEQKSKAMTSLPEYAPSTKGTLEAYKEGENNKMTNDYIM